MVSVAVVVKVATIRNEVEAMAGEAAVVAVVTVVGAFSEHDENLCAFLRVRGAGFDLEGSCHELASCSDTSPCYHARSQASHPCHHRRLRQSGMSTSRSWWCWMITQRNRSMKSSA